MKFLLTLIIFCVTTFAYAETTVQYQPGDAGVSVTIHGMDSDAQSLYEAMNVEPEDGLNVIKKSILLTRMREPILDLMCVKSKTSDATSCTIKFIPGILTIINYEQGYVKFEVIDSYAAPRIANLFVKSNEPGPEQTVFQSLNGKLRLWKGMSAYGQVGAFTVEFSE
jgi:hypothetical protein